jgi:hypothetical protein
METEMLRQIKRIAIAVAALISCPVLSAQVQFTFPIPFATGTSPSVAGSDDLLVEVNQSGEDTVFQLGKISGQKVTWGPVRPFPWKMYNARVSMAIDGRTVISYTGAPHGGGCFYRMGRLFPRGEVDQDFTWTTSEEKWGTCEHTRDSRLLVGQVWSYGVYSDFSQIYQRAGKVSGLNPIIWQDEPQRVAHGRDVDAGGGRNNQDFVILHEEPGPGIIGSLPVRIHPSGAPGGGESLKLPTMGAVRGHVTTNIYPWYGPVVALYYKTSIGLYTMTGYYNLVSGTPSIEWTTGEKEVFAGHVQNSDITHVGPTVVEVHESGGEIFYATGVMPPSRSAGH